MQDSFFSYNGIFLFYHFYSSNMVLLRDIDNEPAKLRGNIVCQTEKFLMLPKDIFFSFSYHVDFLLCTLTRICLKLQVTNIRH